MAVSIMLMHLLPKSKYLEEGEDVAKDSIFQHIQKKMGKVVTDTCSNRQDTDTVNVLSDENGVF